MSNNSGFKGLDINMLQKKKVSELHALAKEIGVMAAGLRKEELIFKIIEANAQKNSDSESGNVMVNTGVLQVIPEGLTAFTANTYSVLPRRTTVRSRLFLNISVNDGQRFGNSSQAVFEWEKIYTYI